MSDEALSVFDSAVTAELQRVSHVEYDSHEICKHFAGELRKRLDGALHSDLEKARAALAASSHAVVLIGERCDKAESERDSLRASLAAMERENKRLREDHQVIQAVYTRSGRAVVCGIPSADHNCDEMGCPSTEHVLWRGPHIIDEKPSRDPMTDWRNGENMAAQNKQRPAFEDLVDIDTGEPLDPMKRTRGGVTREQFEEAQRALSGETHGK